MPQMEGFKFCRVFFTSEEKSARSSNRSISVVSTEIGLTGCSEEGAGTWLEEGEEGKALDLLVNLVMSFW